MSVSRIRGVKSLDRQLKRLQRETPKTVKNGLARLAFAIKDEIGDHIESRLNWSSAGTKKFVARGYRVKYTTQGAAFKALIYPQEKSGAILIKHATGATQRAQGGLLGRNKVDAITAGKRIAIPYRPNVPKSSRGRIKKSQQPHQLLQPTGKNGATKGFISQNGRALMLKRRGSPTPELGFILTEQIKIPQRINVQKVAREAAVKRAGKAFAQAIRKSMLRAGSI